jgi:AbrB family looped-hinge helix DNA binding protein
LVEAEVVTVSSKGQVTIPSKLRKRLRIAKGEQFRAFVENGAIKLVPVPKLSKLAGVDEEVFLGRKPSREVEVMRKEWNRDFEKRTLQT